MATLMLALGGSIEDFDGFGELVGGTSIVVFAISIVALAKRILQNSGRRLGVLTGVLTFTSAIALTPPLLTYAEYGPTSLAIIGWTTVVLVGLLITLGRGAQFSLPLFMLMMVLPTLYYTPAVVLLIFLTVVTISQGPFRKDRSLVPRGLFYWIFFLAYYLFVGTGFFVFAVHQVASLPDLFSGPSRVTLAGNYTQSSASLSFYLSLANAAIVGSLVLWNLFRQRLGGYRSMLPGDRVVEGYALTLIPLGALFFLWAGRTGFVQRIAEWGGVAAVLAVPLLVARTSRNSRKVIVVLVLAAILASIMAFVASSDDVVKFGRASDSEVAAASWLASHSPATSMVFTDHRLAGLLIVYRHLAVTGVNDYQSALLVSGWLDTIYYSTNGDAAYATLRSDFNASYLFVSRSFSTYPPGIKGYDFFYPPAPSGFESKFDITPGFQRLYDDGSSIIFALAGD